MDRKAAVNKRKEINKKENKYLVEKLWKSDIELTIK